MSPPSFEPAPDQVTRPDQLEPAAARMFSPLDDETTIAVWRTHLGYLMLTTLRVVSLWRHSKLLGALGLDPDEWHEGPDFFLYDLAPPRVLGRFVEVANHDGENSGGARFEVKDPTTVAAAIAAEIPEGRARWKARRARVQEHLHDLQASPPVAPSGAVREIVRVVVRVPCRYCGSLMDQGAARCPTCGAAQH